MSMKYLVGHLILDQTVTCSLAGGPVCSHSCLVNKGVQYCGTVCKANLQLNPPQLQLVQQQQLAAETKPTCRYKYVCTS
jgi:hypothetical protein